MSEEPMACCGYKPSEGHNGCCVFYGEDVRAIMALCSRKPHSQDPVAGPFAVSLLREIEAIVAKARDRPALREAEERGKETGAVEWGLAYEEGRDPILARLREPDEEMVEAVAMSMWAQEKGLWERPPWHELEDGVRAIWRDHAREAIRAVVDHLDKRGPS